MAKMIRIKADYERVKNAIGKVTKYKKISTDNKKIIIEELLKTTDNFCPFTGDLSPKARNWTIEHFYERQSNGRRCTDWTNFIHCVSDANINFDSQYDYPYVYCPEKVDYIKVLRCNLLGEIEPINTGDELAENTIIRFGLNHPQKIKCRNDWFNDKDKYKGEPFPFSEYFE
jgi:hypothetical protein